MVITIFRSRLKPEGTEAYYELAPKMGELAKTMPGYISHKVFIAEDGERLTLVEFENEEAQRNWRMNATHVEAQKKGRKDFYAEYKLQICNVVRETAFTAKKGEKVSG